MAEVENLEIRISATADAAIERINKLSNALAGMKSSGANKFLTSLTAQFAAAGTAAKNASKVAERVKILDNIRQKVQPAAGTKQAALGRALQGIDARKFASQFESLDKQIEKTSSKIADLKTKLDWFVQAETANPKFFGADDRAEVDALAQSLSELRQIYSALTAQRSEMWDSFTSARNVSEPINEVKLSLKDLLSTERLTTEASSNLRYALDSMRVGAVGAVGEIGKLTFSGLRKGGELAVSAIKRLNNSLIDFGKNAIKMLFPG